MSFTDQKPFVVTRDRLEAFTRHKKRFGCSLCAHDFKEGDTARWVFANGSNLRSGNFFVCPEHDTPDVLEQGKISFDNAVALSKQWGIYGPDWARDY
jgi:hypothetical protein